MPSLPIQLQQTRQDWSRVLAFAWKNLNVLKNLREDPKTIITELAKGKEGMYPDVDDYTADAANKIKSRTEEDPGESYRGYLPIPDNPFEEMLDKLNQSDLKTLLSKGIDGILKFDQEVDLWAEELLAAWKDRDKLIAIRQDPLKNLIHADQLQKSEYGILPIPDPPAVITSKLDTEELDIEDLQNLLGDEDNMSHLGGIFLFGS
ncbi:hypothetical protein [Myxosarcina sp. GI1]|uniref:hypothetical protein n=1 Tax=Myxosarcina sp. GI1 TaxID=1541065 RepID=UPI00055DC5DB|nr:hypothetical protein [Myxosarcina sp. GI1]